MPSGWVLHSTTRSIHRLARRVARARLSPASATKTSRKRLRRMVEEFRCDLDMTYRCSRTCKPADLIVDGFYVGHGFSKFRLEGQPVLKPIKGSGEILTIGQLRFQQRMNDGDLFEDQPFPRIGPDKVCKTDVAPFVERNGCQFIEIFLSSMRRAARSTAS